MCAASAGMGASAAATIPDPADAAESEWEGASAARAENEAMAEAESEWDGESRSNIHDLDDRAASSAWAGESDARAENEPMAEAESEWDGESDACNADASIVILLWPLSEASELGGGRAALAWWRWALAAPSGTATASVIEPPGPTARRACSPVYSRTAARSPDSTV